MRQASLTIVSAGLLGLALTGTVGGTANAGPPFRATPFTFDPDGTGIVTAAWLTHEGLPDAGNSNHALFLEKDGNTAVNAAAGAEIEGVAGITLTEIGYDVRADGHCQSGAPRFNVTATDGFHFLGACNNATPGSSPAAGWNRFRIDPANPAQAFPPIAAGAKIVSIQVLFDEGTDVGPDFTGFVFIDNIDINGVLIGKPGNAK